MKHIATLATALLLLASCNPNNVRINGKIVTSSPRTIYLEAQGPSSCVVVDSTVTNSKNGQFSFSVKSLKKGVSGFYNVVPKGGERVPLLIKAGENLNLLLEDSLASRYVVTGSHSSTELHKVNMMIRNAEHKLDSLSTIYYEVIALGSADSTLARRVSAEYGATRIALKRNAIAFIMNNACSPVAIRPLYSPLNSGDFIFSEPEDLLYFRLVADSLGIYEPESPYTRALLKDIEKIENSASMAAHIESNLDNVVNYPDLAMPDPLGKVRRLSELDGKVILLSFTSSEVPKLKILNRELLEIYNKYSARGLEVYQVSLDRNKAQWINSVSQGRLPWISVCDLQGGDSPALGLYNITKVPTYVLIGRDGEIVNAQLSQNRVEAAIAAAL